MNSRVVATIFPYDAGNPYQRRIASGLRGLGWEVSFAEWSWRVFRRNTSVPHVLHLHWLHYWLRAPLWKLLVGTGYLWWQFRRYRRSGGVLIWTVHNLQNHEGRHVWRERMLGRMVARAADRIVVHSQSAVQPVCAVYGVAEEKVRVIPLPRYADPEGGLPDRTEARKALGMEEDGLLFVSLGAVRPYKGLEELLAAFEGLEDGEARLVIGGKPMDPSYGDAVAERAAEVHGVTAWLRRLSDEEMALLLAAANAVVLPYRAILTSGALVLAMGAGRACIAPRMGVFEEHLGSDGGVLYEAGKVQALQEALTKAIRRADTLDEMGARNRRLTEEWSPEAVGAATVAMVDEILAERGQIGS